MQDHKPVLLKEVIRHLRCTPGQCFLDGTVGAGGHARAILEKTGPDGLLIGIDRDEDALAVARLNLQPFGDRVVLVRDNFARMGSVLTRMQVQRADGILLDLGLSSFQVDVAERGFSFNQPGPLDMRMDTREEITAAHLINTLSEAELADLIRRYGEERWHKRIARSAVRARAKERIETTERLVEVVLAAIPPSKRPRQIHPATRTFQALRLAVNKELENLHAFLQGALDWLRPGGRLAIISFHSLEDRLVKQTFATWARTCRCPVNLPVCHCEGVPLARLVFKKPVLPGAEEVEANPRARSGRLRVVEKIGPASDEQEENR
ncbi:MAG: 16S rRNA (cytosine(1402)-N(4))-methyltransferase RsmH [Deltaproteobacteria bacterium]|nr:MAG: 16S rRNA (cytosine(1402)-N(4))-methyltransferase RsmH [Deltaproteobacteria bacterium]